MKTPLTYRTSAGRVLASCFLALVILQASILREVHHLFEHHSEEQAHCEAKGPEQHFHSEEYAHVNCTLCLIHIPSAKLDAYSFCLRTPAGVNIPHPFFYKSLVLLATEWSYPQRGPPLTTA